MQKIKTILVLCCVLISNYLSAQRIDNTASFRSINSERYVRVHYDNDFLTAADRYYTQGFNLEVVMPALKRDGFSSVLPRLRNGFEQYGLAIESIGFTPTSIGHTEILVNDRPFAACLMLKAFAISSENRTNNRLTSSLSLGAIGPIVGGEFLQSTIHRYTNNREPLGWNNEIQNDVIVNYEVGHEKQLWRYGDYLLLNTNLRAKVGTLSDKADAGITLMAGKFFSPFAAGAPSGSNFQVYLYTQSLGGLVGYDATLQGGLFNLNSPYVIADKNISRLTFQNNTGIVLSYKKVYAEYYTSYLSPEFKTGKYHLWGGMKIGFIF